MKVVGKKFFRTVLDEGASTLILSLSCWKAIGSPEIVTSPRTLKAFYRRGFQPHGLTPALVVKLGGKTISIQVEVVDLVRLQPPIMKKLVLRHDFCRFDGISNRPVFASREDCNH